jgi:hypothetical protein
LTYLRDIDRHGGFCIVRSKSKRNPRVLDAYREDGQRLKSCQDRALQAILSKCPKRQRSELEVEWLLKGEPFRPRLIVRWNPETKRFDSLITNLPHDRYAISTICLGYTRRWQVGVSSQGHLIQSVQVRPRPKGSSLVAWEAPWRESKTVKPSDIVLETKHGQRIRLQRTVNADVASLHATPVAEPLHNVRRQQGKVERSLQRPVLTGGVSAVTWCEGWGVNWRSPRCPVKKAHRGGVASNREGEMAAQAPGWRIGS